MLFFGRAQFDVATNLLWAFDYPLPNRDQIVAADPSAPALQRQLDGEQIILLLKRGKDLIATGDLAAARLVLQRAADANHAEAALALGATYDPFVLRELKVYGFTPDAAMARVWYEKAIELGSPAAPRRLEMLTKGTGTR
jgi:TPR repeat protein